MMNSQNFRRVSLIALAVSASLGSGTAWSQDAGPQKQAQGSEGEEEAAADKTGHAEIRSIIVAAMVAKTRTGHSVK